MSIFLYQDDLTFVSSITTHLLLLSRRVSIYLFLKYSEQYFGTLHPVIIEQLPYIRGKKYENYWENVEYSHHLSLSLLKFVSL
mgnify:CR=1 FL=1